MVMLPTICITAMNQLDSRLGLNFERTETFIGSAVPPSLRLAKPASSFCRMLVM